MAIKIIVVAGARPNFMKVGPLLACFNRYSEIRPVLVHTGQHYDREMSDYFFKDLGLPEPDVYLGVGTGSHSQQTAKIMTAFEAVVLQEQPEFVVVVGDVNSTLACALVAAKIVYSTGQRPKLVHVEAGLRSFDRSMPEEINRILTDALADILFTTCRDATDNLRKENIEREKIFFVGNVMIDSLLMHRRKADQATVLDRLGLRNGAPHRIAPYAVCTLHRPSNVDSRETLVGVLEALREIGREVPLVYPVHPRTRERLESFRLRDLVAFSHSSEPLNQDNPITCVEPLGYLDFLQLMSNARLMLTDSGGIQEETTILGIPCVTIRENTERPVTISEGTNILAGIDKRGIAKAARQALGDTKRSSRIPEKWDGKAAERIVRVLLSGKLDESD